MTKTMTGLPVFHQLSGNWPEIGPAYIMINLPTHCSLHCPKCALSELWAKAGTPLTADERAQLLAVAKAAGVLTLVVIGMGEPTEHPEVMCPAIKAAHGLGLSSIVFTTLNRLDRAQAEFYRDNNTSLVISLDSLNADTYHRLTGGGHLPRVLDSLALLREVYSRDAVHGSELEGNRIVRLGINTTLTAQNAGEVTALRALAGDDMLYVANPPMPHGKLEKASAWDRLIAPNQLVRQRSTNDDGSFGQEWEALRKLASQCSDTSGHSSLTAGLCGYFSRGVSIHVDGNWLGPCAYGTETAGALGSARGAGAADLLAHYQRVRTAYQRFTLETGRSPSCPLRDPAFPRLVTLLKM